MLIPLAFGSLIGASTLNCLSTLPHLEYVIGVFLGSIFVITPCIWFSNKESLRKMLILLLASIAGFSWASFQALQKRLWQLPIEDIQRPVSICGKVIGISLWHEKLLRLDVEINNYDGKTLTHEAKIRLYWKNPKIFFMDGDNLCATVKLKAPWRFANPGSFDQEKQYFLEGIHADGKLVMLQHYHISSKHSLTRWRQQLNAKMQEILKDKPFLGVIQATTLGIYKNITPEQWAVFQATGTTHAIAISGLHITFIATLFSSLITFVTRRFQVLTNVFPAKCYGAIAALLSAFCYSALAGFSIPTQRAFIMVVISLFALLKRQPIFSWESLALAWLGILCVDPLATLQIGFWLSFGCVAALIYGNTHASTLPFWQKWIVPQIIVFIGLLPLCSFFFQQIPLFSPLANMIVLPLMDSVVVPASLIGLLLMNISPSCALWSFSIAHELLGVVWWLLEKIASLPFNMWQQGHIPWLYLGFAAIAALFLLSPKGLPGRQFCWLGFLPMVFYQAPMLNDGECRFTLLDVGQGLAAVIQTKHHALLYDAGPQYGKESDAGGRIIVPFLHSQHIKSLDKIIISHSDLDHRAGLNGLRLLPVGEILSSEPARLTQFSRACMTGESWEWDGVVFTLLAPDASFKDKKRNNLSCVLKVATKHHSLLLTGDIEERAEKQLVKEQGGALQSNILVVPHHGSLTSSSKNFIEKVSPQYALFPVGLANQYGFPKQAVLQRYEEISSQNLLTWQTGALMFALKDEALMPPICWREASRRYWHF